MADFRKISKEELAAEARQRESENHLDVLQDEGQIDVSHEQEPGPAQVSVDYGVVDQLDPDGVDREPVQVEDTTVVFVPQKDFEGRVNDQKYEAKKGVPVKIPRDVANIWLEDESRGYVRD